MVLFSFSFGEDFSVTTCTRFGNLSSKGYETTDDLSTNSFHLNCIHVNHVPIYISTSGVRWNHVYMYIRVYFSFLSFFFDTNLGPDTYELAIHGLSQQKM